ncbi:MAG: [acyl-carrier-protein] S-malonyltransferase [Planctomycetota bacterium]|nr:MAG: [acyl-carrier-protein] S-malonyltransferase [Planctomycetota bacterium]
MTKIAFLFAGQGAQVVGMGKDLWECEKYRPYFDRLDRKAGENITRIMLDGPSERLNQTRVSQPAILTVSFLLLQALQEKSHGDFTAGLSLGEYTALVYAGCMEFEEALELVILRARFMQEACDQTRSGMLSVIGLQREAVEEIAHQASQKGILQVANYNSPTQFVLSGEDKALDYAMELCQKAGARRLIPLKVAGAYHSPVMAPAKEKLAPYLEKAAMEAPKIPFVSNSRAIFLKTPQEIREALIEQVVAPVRWYDSMKLLISEGMGAAYEIGPGTVLKGLMRQIDRNVKVVSINHLEVLEKLKEP